MPEAIRSRQRGQVNERIEFRLMSGEMMRRSAEEICADISARAEISAHALKYARFVLSESSPVELAMRLECFLTLLKLSAFLGQSHKRASQRFKRQLIFMLKEDSLANAHRDNEID